MSNDSDSDDLSEEVVDPVDKFIDDESDNVIDLFYDLQQRFPWFLTRMRSSHLLSFLTDRKFNVKIKVVKHANTFTRFIEEFDKELETTHFVISTYFCSARNFQVTRDNWNVFCYGYSVG